ncbi:hypothetical protein [Cellulomonas sp. IC4_254]|uniref:hypothetical protein n=1 Tax=Cellulomonas sp. IC4_254 TaxID=2714040 RepID=UPI0014244065|nr:hypothetical protein [Cellulomonas sp. IC4_254]NHT17226.1 hypothetical protein [Cellulomonas sp. IC4_254]
MRRFAGVLLAGALFTGAMSAPALAWTYSSMGGQVTVSGPTISLKDTGNDGRFVSTEFKYNSGRSSSGLSNKLGYGNSTSATVSSDITNAKICISNTLSPMDCGSWRY